MSIRIAAFALVASATVVAAQSPLKSAPSGRATTEVALNVPIPEGQQGPKPMVVKIDYGQPHARGREVPVELSKPGTVWRTGANAPTMLSTDIDLVIGGATVPKGAYLLFTIRTADGYQLILNTKTGQSGSAHDPTGDLARVPLTARALTETRESMQIALVPAGDQSPKGMLTIAWGKLELSTSWALK